MTEMFTKLNDQFGKRYGQQIANLNKNVYISPKNDKGSYEIPTVKLGTGGGFVVPTDEPAYSLPPPAMVGLVFKNMKPFQYVYRVAVPISECEIAANKPEYFNYLFDYVMLAAVSNYKATVGTPDKVRFGTKYIDAQLRDAGENIEIRFHGDWAGEVEDLT